MTRVRQKCEKKTIVNHSSNARLTFIIFCLLGSTDTQQRFLDSLCFVNHNATEVMPLSPSIIVKQALKILMEFFQFRKYFTYCIYCIPL